MHSSASFKMLLLCCLASINCACSMQTIPLETLYSSNNCAIDEPMLKPINSAAELDQLMKSFPASFSKSPSISLRVDLHRQSLILYALGQKPSSGYAIQLEGHEATVKEQKLYLPIRVEKPAKTGFQAQLITSPCSLFSIPKTDFREILIGDN